MTLSAATRIAGVAGSPVTHSLSPLLMNAWIAAARIDAFYCGFPVDPERAETAFRGIVPLGLVGLNVTAPLKSAALNAADTANATARKIGAANVLVSENGFLHAYNTDAPGFIEACEMHDIDVRSGPVLVLGAGGAARAIVHGLVSAGAPEIRLANRSKDAAHQLRDDLAPKGIVYDWEQRSRALGDVRLVVNATTLGMAGKGELDLDWSRCDPRTAAFDSIYAPAVTGFLAGARAAKLKTVNGLAMLIGQARPAFELFFGQRPPDSVDAESLLAGAIEARR